MIVRVGHIGKRIALRSYS